jgi:hypothetical protein
VHAVYQQLREEWGRRRWGHKRLAQYMRVRRDDVTSSGPASMTFCTASSFQRLLLYYNMAVAVCLGLTCSLHSLPSAFVSKALWKLEVPRHNVLLDSRETALGR